MDEQQLRETLRAVPPPDALGAQRRARELVLAAHAGQRPPRRRRRPRWVAAAIAGLVAVGLTLSVVAGPAVARWVRDALGTAAGRPRGPAARLAALPGGGRLLVSSGGDAWIVGQGLTASLGHTDGSVSWSAFGNYVACACGRSLEAVALDGRVAWSERFGAPVRTPLWSPDGNRIAFTTDNELYVTTANGSGARGLRDGGPASTLLDPAAWRPGPGHELAVHDAPGRASLLDTDTDRYVARFPIGPDAVSLSWSANGRRLLAASGQTLRLSSANGGLIAVQHPPPGTVIRAAVLSPSGRQFAYLVTLPGGRQEALLGSVDGPRPGELLLTGRALGDLFFSPDGRWLLVGWHDLGSWLFFGTSRTDAQVRQITDLAARLGNGEPVVEGWCCAARPTPAG